MNRNIFINCPFDDQYYELFDAILFVIYLCGCKPRCALEVDNGAQIRLEKIFSIIKDCDLGIHDISRTELSSNNLPRFNMPLEFGIFLGAQKFGPPKQKQKSCMIFDSDKYRYMEFISDISGQDIKEHKNDYKEVIKKTRNWLNTFTLLQPLPGAAVMIKKYHDYLIDKPTILANFNLTNDDVQYADKTQIIEEWIKVNPI
jgi:hypothetical protein